jgi:HEAT repeat protein
MNRNAFVGKGMRLCLVAALVTALPAMLGCPKSDEPGYYIQRLQKDDDEVQRRAVEELVRMHKKAMPHVRQALQSENPNVRKGCADFLSKVRRMESLVAAGELIDDPDKDVRLKAIEAVSALSQVWKQKAVELLSRAFEHEDPDSVKKAGEGLRDMRYDEATDVLRQEFEAGEGIQAIYAARLLYEIEPEPETARFLVEGLIADLAAVREAAQSNVKELKDKIVAPLVEFIDTEKGTARAAKVLDELRDALIEELDVILDSKRAAKILLALGIIADAPSIEKLNNDLRDTKLETGWRVAAARGLAVAALSSRSDAAQARDIVANLTEVLNDEDQDKRIRIGAAIALCQLKEERAVAYLLDELDRFQEAIKEENISETRLNDLTELRIGAQEALTASGEFVVPFLMERLRREAGVHELVSELRASTEALKDGRLSAEQRRRLAELGVNVQEVLGEGGEEGAAALIAETRSKGPGPIIVWAAAKTLGELGVEDVVPFLRTYVTATTSPEIPVGADGRIVPKEETNWEDLDEDKAAAERSRLEPFDYPDYVRWTAAIALGQVGGEQAAEALRQAEQLESDLLGKLHKNRGLEGYFQRAPVVDGLIWQHEDVLFYVRNALEELGERV